MPSIKSYIPLIKEVAARHGLDPDLVAGIVLTESAGNAWAIRQEPTYKWLFQPEKSKPRGSTLETELVMQKTSWGLMQIMGAVAREYGFRGWMPELCLPETNLEYGCTHVAVQMKRYKGDVDSALAAYNAGAARKNEDGTFRNQHYVDTARKNMQKFWAEAA